MNDGRGPGAGRLARALAGAATHFFSSPAPPEPEAAPLALPRAGPAKGMGGTCNPVAAMPQLRTDGAGTSLCGTELAPAAGGGEFTACTAAAGGKGALLGPSK
jgi:hypothetical protein